MMTTMMMTEGGTTMTATMAAMTTTTAMAMMTSFFFLPRWRRGRRSLRQWWMRNDCCCNPQQRSDASCQSRSRLVVGSLPLSTTKWHATKQSYHCCFSWRVFWRIKAGMPMYSSQMSQAVSNSSP